PRKPDADPDTENVTVADPDSEAGIFVHNQSGNLTIGPATSSGYENLKGAIVVAGRGGIEITNDGGDVTVAGALRTTLDPVGGPGGDVTVDVDSAHRIVLDPPKTVTLFNGSVFDSLVAGETMTFAGDVAVARDTAVRGGDVAFAGPLDATAGATSSALTVTAS